jgi:hypothetical protein
MVNKVVMCLGTNEVSKCKDDSDQVTIARWLKKSLIVSMYSTVGSFIHSLRINLFTLVVVAFNIFVLLPVPPNDVFDLTNTDRKRNLSDITTTPSSVDRKTKHSKLGSATEYWNSNFIWYLHYILFYLIQRKYTIKN